MQIKKPKISKKTIIIASIATILIGIPAVYFLSITNQDNSKAWYSSSWLYRKAISVNNTSGSTKTNEDVLIVLDTASLISAGKLQSDCDDLRMVNSDDTSTISYWIEGGCNTSTTNVWVRIASIPAGTYTIYFYYGNASATNSEASWSGSFLAFSDTTCANGWTRDTTFDNKFIYGSTTYATTGGTAGSHNHGASLSVVSSGASGTGGVGGDTDNIAANLITATHTITGTIGSADSTPQDISTIICKKDDLSNLGNLILLSNSSTPGGWTRISALDSRFPVGSSSYGTTGGSSSHSHTLTSLTMGTSATQNDDIDNPNPNGRGISAPTHIHNTITTVTNSTESNNPPYKVLLYVKSPTLTTLNQTLIAMTTVVPPLGWNQYSALNNYFVMGGSTVNLTAQGSTTHTHTLAFSTNGPSATLWKNASSIQRASSVHTHTASTTLTATLLPQYATAIYIERKSTFTPTVGSEELGNLNPTAPTSLYAEGTTNPTRVTDTTPEFSAIFNDPDTLDTGAYWEIEVNTNSGFTGTVMWDSGKLALTGVTVGERSGDITYAGTTLTLNGTTYYWRIRFWDQNDGVSPWSSVANFRMNATPSQPSSLLAEGETTPQHVTDLTPEFSAIFNDSDGDNATYYEININSELLFNGQMIWNTGQTAMTPLSASTRMPDVSFSDPQNPLTTDGYTYYWRIRFWDQYGSVSAWSSTAQFTMNKTPEAPTLPLTEGAANPIKVSDLTPEFSAIFNDTDNNRGAYYQIEVNTNSSFTGTVKWNSTKTAMTLTTNGTRTPDASYAGSALTANGAIYYWRITLWDEYDTPSPYSATSQFTMSSPPNAPTQPTVDGATNPISIGSINPKFSAVHTDINADSATYYEIEVNSNSSFSGTVIWDTNKTSMTSTANNTRSPEITYAGTTLTGSLNTYYWRIRFWDTDDLVSPWSATANFKDDFAHLYLGGIKVGGTKFN